MFGIPLLWISVLFGFPCPFRLENSFPNISGLGMAKGRKVPGPGRDQNGTKRELTLVPGRDFEWLVPKILVSLKYWHFSPNFQLFEPKSTDNYKRWLKILQNCNIFKSLISNLTFFGIRGLCKWNLKFQNIKLLKKTTHFEKKIFWSFGQKVPFRGGTGPAGRDLEKLVPGRDRDLKFGPVCHAYSGRLLKYVAWFSNNYHASVDCYWINRCAAAYSFWVTQSVKYFGVFAKITVYDTSGTGLHDKLFIFYLKINIL